MSQQLDKPSATVSPPSQGVTDELHGWSGGFVSLPPAL